MALNPEIGTISTDITEEIATIPDNTSYGSPEADRSDVAVYLQVWKMNSDNEETAITITNSTPDTVENWSFTYTEDGWYKARMIIIPNYDNSTVYTAGEAVYYDGAIYIAAQASLGNLPSNPVYWTASTDFDDIVEGDNVISEYFDFVLIEYGKKCAGEAAVNWYNNQDCGNCDKLKLSESFLQKRGMVIAVQRFEAIQQYSKAETIARRLENICESC
jgi:hypothetical protein